MHPLARHPHAEQRLHAEVETVLAGASAAYEHLPRLAFTTDVITEALRLYPPGWLFTRTVTDTELGGHHLPVGTSLAFSPYLPMR
ncbi:cytochrome P450 [Spongiactinospora gelatinilytica]|uniref:cytochrome P450 n=1 Tax=Spongiactinospora gelatinilytica TaxID=2666298 RepID=UPI0018F53898|nr:cytochrome P450 [Spongiactinospora gelatinilytica]